MRIISQSRKFRRSRKKLEKSGRYTSTAEIRFDTAVLALANDEPLDASYHDHALTGNMHGARECHILFDLLLIYWYEGDDVLFLDNIGSHSEALGL